MSNETTTQTWRQVWKTLLIHGFLLLLLLTMMSCLLDSCRESYTKMDMELPLPALLVGACWQFLSGWGGLLAVMPIAAILYGWVITRFLHPDRRGLARAFSATISVVLGLCAVLCAMTYMITLTKLNLAVGKVTGPTYFAGGTGAMIVLGVFTSFILIPTLFFMPKRRQTSLARVFSIAISIMFYLIVALYALMWVSILYALIRDL